MKIDDCIVVFGGMLYFILFIEAQKQNLIEDDLNIDILNQFWNLKTVDLDLYAFVNIDGSKKFTMSADKIFTEFSKLLNDSYLSKYLTNITRILEPIPYKSLDAIDIKSNPLLGLSLINMANGEIRPRLLSRLGNNDDHILEILIQYDVDDGIKTIYDVNWLDRPFCGENLISSITSQLYPTERGWNHNNQRDYLKMSNDQVYSSVRNRLKEDKLLYTKFKQGFYRSYVATYILRKSFEKNNTKLLNTILPTNRGLTDKMFYMQSRLVRKLVPDLSKKSLILRLNIKKLDENIQATAPHTLAFLNICLKMWKIFELNIDM
jgi:hypothetical protein